MQDLKHQNQALKDSYISKFLEVLETGNFVSGFQVEKFEEEFSRFIGTRYAIACSTGSSALRMALKAMGVKPGDRVLVPSMTFVASAQAIIDIDAIPVFVDSDESTWNISPDALRENLNESISAIIPVDLHGRCVDYEQIRSATSGYGLRILEDAAQAHGAKRNEIAAGSYGDAAGFSFYPGKNLGGLGEGGMVTTNDEEIATKVKLLRNWGSKEKYIHEILGGNERMDELQAAFLGIKLKNLSEWTDKRTAAAKIYDQLLDKNGISRPISDDSRHVYHIYSVRVKNRDKIMSLLKEKNIFVGSHYPIPIHLQPAYKKFWTEKQQLPVAETLAKEFLSLPLWESISEEDINIVVENLVQVLNYVNS